MIADDAHELTSCVCSLPGAGVGAGVGRAEEPSPVSSQPWRGDPHPALSGGDLWWCWVGFHALSILVTDPITSEEMQASRSNFYFKHLQTPALFFLFRIYSLLAF